MTQQPSPATDSTDSSVTDTEMPRSAQQSPVSDLPADPDRNLPVPRQSHIISTVLAPALRLWLRSQVESVGELQVVIEGGDRQILRGILPRITLMAQDVVYEGLYMSQVRLVGRGIQVNFGQVLRGKPLRLARSVPVQVEATFSEEDINDSLETPLMFNVFNDLLIQLLRAGAAPELVDPTSKRSMVLDNFKARLQPERLLLSAELVAARQGTNLPFALRTGLRLAGRSQLRLANPEWLTSLNAKRGLPLHDLDGFPLDLGSDFSLDLLALEEGRLRLRGTVNVVPDDADAPA